jgi:hypothetical protein
MPWLDAYCCENATASSYRADRAGVIFTWGTQRWQRAAAEGCAVVDSCCCYCTSTAIHYSTVLVSEYSTVQSVHHSTLVYSKVVACKDPLARREPWLMVTGPGQQTYIFWALSNKLTGPEWSNTGHTSSDEDAKGQRHVDRPAKFLLMSHTYLLPLYYSAIRSM